MTDNRRLWAWEFSSWKYKEAAVERNWQRGFLKYVGSLDYYEKKWWFFLKDLTFVKKCKCGKFAVEWVSNDIISMNISLPSWITDFLRKSEKIAVRKNYKNNFKIVFISIKCVIVLECIFGKFKVRQKTGTNPSS